MYQNQSQCAKVWQRKVRKTSLERREITPLICYSGKSEFHWYCPKKTRFQISCRLFFTFTIYYPVYSTCMHSMGRIQFFSSSSGTRSPSIGFAGCIWCYIRRTHWPAIRNWRFYQAVLLWACPRAPTIFLGAECIPRLEAGTFTVIWNRFRKAQLAL